MAHESAAVSRGEKKTPTNATRRRLCVYRCADTSGWKNSVYYMREPQVCNLGEIRGIETAAHVIRSSDRRTISFLLHTHVVTIVWRDITLYIEKWNVYIYRGLCLDSVTIIVHYKERERENVIFASN